MHTYTWPAALAKYQNPIVDIRRVAARVLSAYRHRPALSCSAYHTRHTSGATYYNMTLWEREHGRVTLHNHNVCTTLCSTGAADALHNLSRRGQLHSVRHVVQKALYADVPLYIHAPFGFNMPRGAFILERPRAHPIWMFICNPSVCISNSICAYAI